MVTRLIDRRAHSERARDGQLQPETWLRGLFRDLIDEETVVDAQFIDSSRRSVLGVAGLPFKAPVVTRLLSDRELYVFLSDLWRDGGSLLIVAPRDEDLPRVYTRGGNGSAVPWRPAGALAHFAPGASGHGSFQSVIEKIDAVLRGVRDWAGRLNERGELVVDLRTPAPGPHFFANLLLGDRVGHAKPLQTTPKSVVDRMGRGSFRAHAATQVLATRWDMRAEENGFPANRQFYLTESGKQVFYSADPNDDNVEMARAVLGQNQTTITYRTRCGLEISRHIRLLAYEEGLPLATEVQSIRITNRSAVRRNLRLVVTGMFGAVAPGALQEDVVFTNVSMEARILSREDGTVIAVSPHYHSSWAAEDERFHSLIVHVGGETLFPREFCTSYNEFVGEGTLERPQGLHLLANRLVRKGPGFFALAAGLALDPGESARADNFTGLVSRHAELGPAEGGLVGQVERLLERFAVEGELERTLMCQQEAYERYRRHVQVRTGDANLDSYINYNLPFQILYQTFVSRSFDQTQKGYREIGFREIQDLFASMSFFIANGQRSLVKDLLKEWASQVFAFGYAYHNFYWKGKEGEAGDWSDDALWLVQAVDRYLAFTDDTAFLDERCAVAGVAPAQQRSIYETIQAVLRYSAEISVGKHGLPLLDKADWNDTLQLDGNYLNGPQKEAAYGEQQRAAVEPGGALQSEYSESVMNAFLLKVALDGARRMAARRGDRVYQERVERLTRNLCANLQHHAWQGDFFARVLFNKYPADGYAYLGAGGDRLSDDPDLDGTYFLNSFSWSILAGVATEEQIRTMLSVVKRVLLTPHGLKLCSPVRFGDISARGGSGEYFPGDRENGGVFKHANMMAAAALLEAAKAVSDDALARELAGLAHQVIAVVAPVRTLRDPYVLAGNPRFCTQYNNSETGENVGPMLSGTSTWLWLALMSAWGVHVSGDGILLDPILPDDQRELRIAVTTEGATYEIAIRKPEGFYRVRDARPTVLVDGEAAPDNRLPRFADGRVHRLEMTFL